MGHTTSQEQLELLLLQPRSTSIRQQVERSNSVSMFSLPRSGNKASSKAQPSSDSASDEIPEARGSTHLPQRALWPRWRNVWILDFLVAFFSVGCMLAIAVIILAMHDRPLLQWKLPIAPNALILVFATISKSTMLLALAEGIGQLKWIHF